MGAEEGFLAGALTTVFSVAAIHLAIDALGNAYAPGAYHAFKGLGVGAAALLPGSQVAEGSDVAENAIQALLN